MGIDLLDVCFRIEKRFGMKIRYQLAVPLQMWTAGDLFEYVWHGLQGEEPAWGAWDAKQEILIPSWKRREQTTAYLSSFQTGWGGLFTIVPSRLDRMIPEDRRLEVWNRVAEIWGVDPPPLLGSSPLGSSSIDSEIRSFPPRCMTTNDLMDVFERAWWIGLFKYQDQWRPSTTPPPKEAAKWTRESAWEVMVETISYSFGVKPEEVTPEARLIADLGMG